MLEVVINIIHPVVLEISSEGKTSKPFGAREDSAYLLGNDVAHVVGSENHGKKSASKRIRT